MYITAPQPVRNIGIAIFAGIAVFARLRCLNVIVVGSQSEPSVVRSSENCVMPRMHCMPYIHNRKLNGRFYGLDFKGNGRLGKLARNSQDYGGNAADLKSYGNKTGHKRSTWLIAFREILLEPFL